MASNLKAKEKNAATPFRRARNTLRQDWPDVYWATIPIKDPKTLEESWEWHCFLLPHEWVAKIGERPGFAEACKATVGTKLHSTFLIQCLQAGLPAEGTVPLGLHGDAVPVLGTIRKQSLDFITVNLPGCHRWPERVPFTVLQGKYNLGQKTRDEIWKIFLWSLNILKTGNFPDCRHDGSHWLKSDKKRKLIGGKSLPARGILCEIRGDWDWYNAWLQLPTWNTKWGMCWLCKANHENFKTFDTNARNIPWTKAEFIANVTGMGKTLSVFWHWEEHDPAVLVRPDWLHAVDRGIGADIAGGLLLEMAQNCPGRSLKERVASLWQDLQKVYKDNKTEYRIDTLTPQKLNKGGNVPTLKALAAQVRLLMHLLPILAEKHFDFRIPHQLACQKLARFIGKAYTYMESNQLQKLPEACQKVAEQYKQLQREAEKGDDFNSWHIMPKMHLFQHLCELGSSCKDLWTYKDETAGGTFAKFFVRRGGKDNPGHNCFEVLERWACSQDMPTFS